MLRAVLFDLFETLVTESATRPAGVSSLAPALGCERDAFRREWKAIRPAILLGRVTFREALRRIAATLGGHVDDEMLRRICDERIRMKAEPFQRIEPPVVEMSARLRARNLRLGIICNGFPEDVAAWPRCPLAPRFDAAVFSFEVGRAKPDPDVYLEATRRLGVGPEHALFVGDGLNDELSGADRAGLRAVRVLWFVKRWPHFRDEPCAYRTAETTDELMRLVEQSIVEGPSSAARPDA